MERDSGSTTTRDDAARRPGAAAGAVLAMPASLSRRIRQLPYRPSSRTRRGRAFSRLRSDRVGCCLQSIRLRAAGAEIQARWRSNSEETRRRLGAPRRESYGPSAIEKLDIFRTSRANAPVIIYVHGGAWITEEASGYHFAAENMTGAGAHYVALDFAPVNALNGDLRVMADQVRRGIAWVHKNVATFGGDPNRIFVCGHSSGAHLAGVALITDWQKDYGLPADIIKGGVLLSGLYEMKPVRLSSRGTYVKFDDTWKTP
jgi:acetyl esterase/lipase